MINEVTMGRCKIFTNSIADLPAQFVEQYDIGVVPELVIIKDKEYFCGIDLDAPQLYDLMRQSDVLPGTSHPNEYNYETCFKTAEQYDEILCITVTSVMSGSYQTASLAARSLAEEGFKPPIYVYDSLHVSCGQSLMVLDAAKMAQDGESAAQIMRYLDSIRSKIGVYFCLRSLENAKKGGRVGEIKSLAAGLLKILPVLTFRDGTIKELRLVRNFQKAVLSLAEYYKKSGKKGGKVLIYHANNEKDALRLKECILRDEPCADILIDWIGPAIGIYAGEGAIGIAFIE